MSHTRPAGMESVRPATSTLEAVARPLLRLAHLVTHMETTFVTGIDWEDQRQEVLLSLNTGEMELREGAKVDWTDSMCRSMFLSGLTCTADVGSEVTATSGASALGMKSFFAVPILVDDHPIGTVCGASRSEVVLSETQLELMQLIADALQHVFRAEAERSKAVLVAELAQIEAKEARSEAKLHAGHASSMEALAHTDDLTDLPNRRAFVASWEDALARSGRRSHPIGLLLIDVDRFKSVNDSMGHGVGDRVLQAVASALHSATVSGNVLGRLGGDEFAVAISHIDGTALVAVANQIRSSFNQVVGQLGVQATLSIGVVSSEDCPRGEMLSCADIALYLAKSSGRDRAWLYNPDTDHAGGVFTECEI